jgi:ABC-type transport system involved in cytochrome c biogenesis ATPase subunit
MEVLMRTSKIVIRNLFGLKETVLNGESIEITGTNGAGKTSVNELEVATL